MARLNMDNFFIIFLLIFTFIQGKDKKLLLVGIDGCRSDALQLAKTPNIDSLIKNGLYITNALCSINGQLTKSGPGWTTLLTGVWSDKHGVVDNSFDGLNIREYPPFNVLMSNFFDTFKMASFIMWEPILEHIFGNTLAYSRLFSKYDESMAIEASNYILETKLDAIFIDFDHVDRSGHWFGFKAKKGRYLKTIEKVDMYIGWIYDAVIERETYDREDWLIIITSDHGGIKHSHGGQSHKEKEVPIILNGSNIKKDNISRQVYLTDIVPTILNHFGLPVKYKRGLVGSSLINN